MLHTGMKIRSLREKAGLTQAQMARRLQCSVSTVEKLERGVRRPTLQMVSALCNLFEVSSAALMPGSGHVSPPSYALMRWAVDMDLTHDDVLKIKRLWQVIEEDRRDR